MWATCSPSCWRFCETACSRRDHALDLTPPRASDDPSVSGETALQALDADSTSLGADPRVLLARATVHDYGEVTPTGIDLRIEDQLIWLVWWENVDVSGYARRGDQVVGAQGDVIVLTSAATGDTLGTWVG